MCMPTGVLLAKTVSQRAAGPRPGDAASEAERPPEVVKGDDPTLSSGTMEIKLSRGTLRIAGSVDVVALRTVPSSE